MRRVFVPALLAVAMVASSSVNASAFGLFDKLCKSDCDTCCDIEPVCGCEAPAPVCGCEAVDPCCDSGCGSHKKGFFHKLFHKNRGCCDTGCAAEPVCGCEMVAPACGCEVAPACGCEVAPSCGCEPAPCCGKKSCGIKGLLDKLFHKHNNCCDSGCAAEPACGCEVAGPCGCAAEPTCGCEPACGCEPTCGF